MSTILVIAEHRQQQLRDVNGELIALAQKIASPLESQVKVLLLGENVQEMAEELASYGVSVLKAEARALTVYDASTYLQAILSVMEAENPLLVLTGQTAQGVDFMPALAVKKNLPYIPEVIDLMVEEGRLKAQRQIYSGKVHALFSFPREKTALATAREGAVEAAEKSGGGKIQEIPLSLDVETPVRSFIEYQEAQVGEVDITQSPVLVGIGRGLREEKNLPLAQDLADILKAHLCGSRPAIDLGWLESDRQVGVSGKTVKPKLYLALGISGAFQHTSGMKGAQKIAAINKDPHAPIFAVADYAIVEDLFKVVPLLTEKLQELVE